MTKKNETKGKKGIIESRYNPTLLRELCEQKVDAQTALKRLELKSLQSLRSHLMRLSVEDSELRSLPNLYSRSTGTVNLNKMGIKLTPKKLELAGASFPQGTEFSIEVDEDMIVLRNTIATSDENKEEQTG